jgi:ribosomal protein S18 acetylase RimI-like enzyme
MHVRGPDCIDITVRAATNGDAALLSELDVATWGNGHDGALSDDLIAGLASSPWHDLTFWQERLEDRSRRHWVWLIGSPEPVGYVTFGANTEPDWPDYRGEIERFYLLKDWRGRGLGSQLWRKAVGHLAEAGLLPYLTTVFTFNTGAQRFYERQGGRRRGEQTAFEWNGTPVREYVYGFECHDPPH